MSSCKDCQDTGYITLFTSTVECGCNQFGLVTCIPNVHQIKLHDVSPDKAGRICDCLNKIRDIFTLVEDYDNLYVLEFDSSDDFYIFLRDPYNKIWHHSSQCIEYCSDRIYILIDSGYLYLDMNKLVEFANYIVD